jgi:outer membrane protein assembly factor BamB
MTLRRLFAAVFVATAWAAPARAFDVELISPGDLGRLDLQRYWHLRLPLEPGEAVVRLALVDDSLYALTTSNRALSIHSKTGVLRWSNFVAEEGQTIRGPSHAAQYVFFTTPGAVRVFDRQSGDLAGQPRALRGVVIEVMGETATISVGSDHGVQLGDVLNIYRTGPGGEREGPVQAHLRITTVRGRWSRGRLERMPAAEKARPGDRVEADVILPLQEVKLPFAASCAAVADKQRIYVGTANQRFYAVDILSGVRQWQLLTPHTVSATPVIYKENLYIAGQDGQVVSCTKDERARNWMFQTEAPIFADPVVDSKRVIVASTDRSVYCLDRISGARLWRERFDTPLDEAPRVAGGKVYQIVPQQGLFVMNVEDGKRAWNRPEGGLLLGQMGDDVYLLATEGSPMVLRVSAADGRRKEQASAATVEFGAGAPADPSIFVGNSMGDLVCLRPAGAPHLKPEEVEAALRSDRKIQLAAEIEAKAAETRKKEQPAPALKPRSPFEDDDGLASRSTAKPVGGHGVLKEPAKPAAAKAPRADGEEPKDAEETKEGEEAKEGEEGAEAASTDEEAAEKPSDEAGEDKAEPEEGEEDAKPDETESEATTKEADDEDKEEKDGDEESKEGGG